MKALDRARPAATAAAALATMCAASTLVPLFDSARWAVPVLATIAAMALTGAIARAAKVPAPLQPLLQLAVLLTLLTIQFAQPEAALGFLPGPVALEQLQVF
ncbi:MAG: transglutaminaseTgpA domain-containing protein, partial [Actinomycetota bacterium]